ncbi:zinc finger protein Xfin isoform X2 [Musca domestica]|uniref:Zinc finger protein Xfin isoform X2 n=1 Tax=Musca domestica TaxID=7370 RepID=A0A9J7IFX8_MUSDO|nr:zinc finger protein Xfin isoform X2 [Musca domestica]
MDVDTGKICRCCLSLNSNPLLSIYQSDGAGGCVANMIASITNLELRQHDKMPEKVCLSCASEINRCYVFKIKCESSNKTLRQLLPDVAVECDSLEKNSVRAIGIQTDAVCVRSTLCQTLDFASTTMKTKEVQTEAVTYNESNEEGANEGLQLTHCGDDAGFCENREKERTAFKTLRSEQHFSLVTSEHSENGESYIVVETDSINNDESSMPEEHKYLVQESVDPAGDEIIENNEETSSFDFYEDMEQNMPEYSETKSYNGVGNECINQANDYRADDANEQYANETGVQTDIASKRLRSSGKRKEQHKCPMCIMAFVSLKVLRRHIAKRHSSVDIDDAVSKTAYTAEVQQESEENLSNSDVVTDSQQELTEVNVPKPRLLSRTRHSNKLNEQQYSSFKFYCEYCQAGFAQRKTLTYHMKQNCMTSNFKEKLDEHNLTHKNHPCLECKHVCDSVEELSEHMIEVHNRNARNQCHVCKKVFTMKASLIDHLRVHSGDKPFVCTICGKRFTQNSNLRQHIMRHQNKKDFMCDLCPNAYVTKAELFSHKRTHTGETPFKCNFCNTSFTSSSSLQKHVRKHTGERPYSCDICPMRFTALNILKNHHRTHTGERPYKCLFCEKSFTQKGDCLLHQRTHEFGEIKCFCGSTFSKINNLRIHLKVKHPNMTDEEIRSINDLLKVKCNKEEDTETHITLMEVGDDDEGEMTLNTSRVDNGDEMTEIAM